MTRNHNLLLVMEDAVISPQHLALCDEVLDEAATELNISSRVALQIGSDLLIRLLASGTHDRAQLKSGVMSFLKELAI